MRAHVLLSTLSLLSLGAASAQDSGTVPLDLTQAFTPQFSLRFIQAGTVPRRLDSLTGTALSANPALSPTLSRLPPAALDGARRATPALSTVAGVTTATTSVVPTALVGLKDLPFALPGTKSVALRQFQAASVIFSDRSGQQLVSQSDLYRVRPVSGAFDFNIGRIDPAIWHQVVASPGSIVASGFTSDVVPSVSHIMTFRNMTRNSRLDVTIDRQALVSEDQDDFTATNIVISGQTPGIEVTRTSSDSRSTTYSIVATADQDLGSIEFSPTTDILPLPTEALRKTGPADSYADQMYPPGVNPQNFKLTEDSVDYRDLYSPFSRNTPLDFRWSPLLDTTFASVGLTHFSLPGKQVRAFTFPGKAVVDPVQLAWESNFGNLASRLKRPTSPWQESLTPSFCRTAFQGRTRLAGLEGPASIASSGANLDLFGSTGACYFNGVYHEGTDFMVGPGSQIHAIMSGRVHTSGHWKYAGGHVGIVVGEFKPIGTTITGPFYLEIQYLHLNHCKFRFKPNQVIQAGEVLGVTAASSDNVNNMCTTTYSPHLHIDTAVVYYDHGVMHKFYFDSLLFLGQADAFGLQLRKVLLPGKGGADTDGNNTVQPPVLKGYGFTACTVWSGAVVTLLPGGLRSCTLEIGYVPNGLELAKAEFTYSLGFAANGQTQTTPVLPGTDVWTPRSGNVRLTSGPGKFQFLLPISVRQRADRRYTVINVMAHLSYIGGATRDLTVHLPVSTGH